MGGGELAGQLAQLDLSVGPTPPSIGDARAISEITDRILRELSTVQRLNVFAQALAARGEGEALRLSLSSNPDISFEGLERTRRPACRC